MTSEEQFSESPRLYRLDNGDILRVDDGDLPFIRGNTCLIEDLLISQRNRFYENCQEWNIFDDGLECRILRPGSKNWVSGKVRFYLEIATNTDNAPQLTEDEPDESPLDAIRKLADE
ncbi:MAG: hypothetical protein BJG00_010400 [Limnothrix sp. CACIAM 69d]|jgi:hypothetical protein|nr:MAG: hypothetical protein BJG00_010400 [Limnothrix sp. CACIAM 69d]